MGWNHPQKYIEVNMQKQIIKPIPQSARSA
jgi:hypothetical protein